MVNIITVCRTENGNIFIKNSLLSVSLAVALPGSKCVIRCTLWHSMWPGTGHGGLQQVYGMCRISNLFIETSTATLPEKNLIQIRIVYI